MDPKEEQRLLELYDEVSSNEYSKSYSTNSERSDPFEDRECEFNINDPPYQPRYSDISSSSENENPEREILVAESNHEYVDTENETNENEDDEWLECVKDIPNFNFDQDAAGIKINITDNMSALEVFQMLWTCEIKDLLIRCSNKYGEKLAKTARPHRKNSRSSKFLPIESKEFDVFIALTLLRAQIGYSELRKVFSVDPLYYHPIFSHYISGRRYEQILRYLCCYENLGQDKLYKVQPLLDIIIQNFQNACSPHEHLSLDESLLLFRGRLSFRQYIKNKRARYGIKFFELCGPDGYLFNLEIYKGKSEKVEAESKVDSLVMRLMSPYLNRGHHLVMDNFYNSAKLSENLLKHKTHTTGTLRSNRKGNPKVVTLKKLKKGEYIWRRRNSVYISKWRDNRDVLLLTTKYHPKLIEVSNRFGKVKLKPIEVAEYNKYLSGVDRLDQLVSYYSCPRKTIRWYKKIIFHLLDITMFNAFILFKKKIKKIRMIEFREKVIRGLLEIPENQKNGRLFLETSKTIAIHDNRRAQVRQSQNVIPHFPEKIPLPSENYKRKNYFLNCKECLKKDKRTQVSYRCKGCEEKPPLCPTCFESFHSATSD